MSVIQVFREGVRFNVLFQSSEGFFKLQFVIICELFIGVVSEGFFYK